MRALAAALTVTVSCSVLADPGSARALRTVDAFVSSMIVTEGIKSFVREERPNHKDSRSFPSEHATAAFAISTVQASYDPRHAGLWYAGAAGVAAWRLSEKEHFLQDVVAGGLIGYVTAREVMRRPHGLLVTPLFEHGSVGVNLVYRP